MCMCILLYKILKQLILSGVYMRFLVLVILMILHLLNWVHHSWKYFKLFIEFWLHLFALSYGTSTSSKCLVVVADLREFMHLVLFTAFFHGFSFVVSSSETTALDLWKTKHRFANTCSIWIRSKYGQYGVEMDLNYLLPNTVMAKEKGNKYLVALLTIFEHLLALSSISDYC